MKGKNFSANNISGKRNEKDFYQTPFSLTQQLLEYESFDFSKNVLEPCSGEGAIVKVLEKYFHKPIIYCDLKKHNLNFLEAIHSGIDYIITNPPFSKAFEFIQKAKEVAKEKFVMLLPLSYLHGQKRYDAKIFRDKNYPLTGIHIFTRYPMLSDGIRKDGKYITGMIAYMWAVWTKNSNSCDPTFKINWLDNNKYVLKKKELKEQGDLII